MMGNDGAEWKGVKDMALSKRERRRALARLSFEEKIRILLTMQTMAKGVQRAGSKRRRVVWDI